MFLFWLVLGPPRKKPCRVDNEAIPQSFFIHVPNKEKGTRPLHGEK